MLVALLGQQSVEAPTRVREPLSDELITPVWLSAIDCNKLRSDIGSAKTKSGAHASGRYMKERRMLEHSC